MKHEYRLFIYLYQVELGWFGLEWVQFRLKVPCNQNLFKVSWDF